MNKIFIKKVSNKKFLVIILLIFVSFLSSKNTTKSVLFVKRGVLIPFYIYPNFWEESCQWKRLKETIKSVELWLIMNPNSGPGDVKDPYYELGLSYLNDKKIKIFCYVPTDYGKRDIEKAKSDVEKYIKFYSKHSLFGIFYDEVDNTASSIAYYREIYNYAKKLGFKWVILNPGLPIDEKFLKEKVGDTIVIFEDTYINFLSYDFPNYIKRYPTDRFAILVHDVKNFDNAKIVIDKSKHVKFIYCTDDSEPNPWDSLPSYWNDFVELFYNPSIKE